MNDVFAPVNLENDVLWPKRLMDAAPKPIRDALTERARLIGLAREARDAHLQLISDASISAAVTKDNDLLAVASAKGSTDPGDPNFNSLVTEIKNAKRKAVGLRMALDKQNRLLDELLRGPLGDEFREKVIEPREKYVSELAETLRRAQELTNVIDLIDGEYDFVGSHVATRRNEAYEKLFGGKVTIAPIGVPSSSEKAVLNSLSADFLLQTIGHVYRGNDSVRVGAFDPNTAAVITKDSPPLVAKR